MIKQKELTIHEIAQIYRQEWQGAALAKLLMAFDAKVNQDFDQALAILDTTQRLEILQAAVIWLDGYGYGDMTLPGLKRKEQQLRPKPPKSQKTNPASLVVLAGFIVVTLLPVQQSLQFHSALDKDPAAQWLVTLLLEGLAAWTGLTLFTQNVKYRARLVAAISLPALLVALTYLSFRYYIGL